MTNESNSSKFSEQMSACIQRLRQRASGRWHGNQVFEHSALVDCRLLRASERRPFEEAPTLNHTFPSFYPRCFNLLAHFPFLSILSFSVSLFLSLSLSFSFGSIPFLSVCFVIFLSVHLSFPCFRNPSFCLAFFLEELSFTILS